MPSSSHAFTFVVISPLGHIERLRALAWPLFGSDATAFLWSPWSHAFTVAVVHSPGEIERLRAPVLAAFWYHNAAFQAVLGHAFTVMSYLYPQGILSVCACPCSAAFRNHATASAVVLGHALKPMIVTSRPRYILSVYVPLRRRFPQPCPGCLGFCLIFEPRLETM